MQQVLIISPKNVYATKRLRYECREQNVRATFFDVHELAEKKFEIDISKYDVLYVRQAWPYFVEVAQLAQQFLDTGKRVIDPQIAKGEIAQGKWGTYQFLKQAGIPQPYTTVLSESAIQYPVIIKWIYGFGGKQVHLVNGNEHLQKIVQQHPKEELVAQEFIKAKYEYKVITVGFGAVSSVLRLETNKETFRPDFTKAVELHADSERIRHVVLIAERAAKALGRELAKVDLLEDFDGNLFVLEVNRIPGFQNFEQLTGFNVAAEFVGYIKRLT